MLTMFRTGFTQKLDMTWHAKRCWG